MKKMNISELTNFETNNNVWNIKFLDSKIWIHYRASLIENDSPIPFKYSVSLKNMIISTYKTIKFLIRQKNYRTVYFLRDRFELLQAYETDTTTKILFLNAEQEKYYQNNDFISCDFFNLIRFICRKIAYLIYKKQYNDLLNKINTILPNKSNEYTLKLAMGDALHLKFLSKILIKSSYKVYTGAVIPLGEKFANLLNSAELQHGVIYDTHPNLIGIPDIKNDFIVYHKKYIQILKKYNYSGNIIFNDFKKQLLDCKVERTFKIVIYTQPLENFTKSIDKFFETSKPKDVYIQKHPRDYYNYQHIDAKYFIKHTTPQEVVFPIMYSSSIIDNFTEINKDCYIFDAKDKDVILEQFLETYKYDTKSHLIISDDLEELYHNILKI